MSNVENNASDLAIQLGRAFIAMGNTPTKIAMAQRIFGVRWHEPLERLERIGSNKLKISTA